MVIGGHLIALAHHILLAQLYRVHVQTGREFIYCGLNGEKSLRSAVAAVRSGGHLVRIHNVVRKAVRLEIPVQRDGLVAGKAYRCGAVLAVSSCIRERVDVDRADLSVIHRSDANLHFHLMARAGSNLALLAAENNLGRLLRHPGHKRRIDLADGRLLRTEAAADSRLGYTDLRLRNSERI